MRDIEQQLSEAIEFVASSASEAKGFLVEQAPLYVQEYLAWQFTYAVLSSAILLLIVLVLLCVSVRFWGCYTRGVKAAKAAGVSKYADDSDLHLIPSFLVLFLAVMVSLGVARNTAHAIKIKVAPRVVVLEHIRELAR